MIDDTRTLDELARDPSPEARAALRELGILLHEWGARFEARVAEEDDHERRRAVYIARKRERKRRARMGL